VLTYSPHTLSRATHETAGRSAKQFIDDRVVLGGDAPARRKPCVRLAARRASCRCGHRPPAGLTVGG